MMCDFLGSLALARMERLEPRSMMSAVLGPDHVLTLTGTRRADVMMVSLMPGDPTHMQFNMGAEHDVFLVSDVMGIHMSGGAGADKMVMDESNGAMMMPVTMSGGGANDTLVGGSGDAEYSTSFHH